MTNYLAILHSVFFHNLNSTNLVLPSQINTFLLHCPRKFFNTVLTKTAKTLPNKHLGHKLYALSILLPTGTELRIKNTPTIYPG